MASLNDLPIEVLTHVMRFLPVADRKELSLVNKTFYRASMDPVLQRDIVFNLQTLLNNYDALSPERIGANMVIDGFGDNERWLELFEKYGTSLLSLSVRGCDITESTFITFLSYCRKLTSLDLTGCSSPFMTGTLLQSESDRKLLQKSLVNVKELKLSSVRYLSNTTFNRLVSVLGTLESLDLSCCQLLFHSTKYSSYADGTLFTFGNVLDYIRKNPKLKSIALAKTACTNDALSSLASIQGLELISVDLSYCKDVGNSGVKDLSGKQSKIQNLNLDGCKEVGDLAVEEIVKNLTELKSLSLKECDGITDRSVSKLHSLHPLQNLNLANVHRPSQAGLIKGLSPDLSSLTSLCLSGNSAVSDVVLVTLCTNLPQLQSLNVSSCFYVTDQGLAVIFHDLQDLRELNVAHCQKITDLGLLGLKSDESDHDHSVRGPCKCIRKNAPFVIQLGIPLDDFPNITSDQIENLRNDVDYHVASVRNLTHLNSLNLRGISNISDLSLIQAIDFYDLKTLSLDSCYRVSDESIIAIANKNLNLEELYLCSTGLSDIGLKHLITRLKRLRVLVIRSCDRITDFSITAIGNHGHRLKHLDVSFCTQVTEAGMEYLDLKLPNLHEVHKRCIKAD